MPSKESRLAFAGVRSPSCAVWYSAVTVFVHSVRFSSLSYCSIVSIYFQLYILVLSVRYASASGTFITTIMPTPEVPIQQAESAIRRWSESEEDDLMIIAKN